MEVRLFCLHRTYKKLNTDFIYDFTDAVVCIVYTAGRVAAILTVSQMTLGGSAYVYDSTLEMCGNNFFCTKSLAS